MDGGVKEMLALPTHQVMLWFVDRGSFLWMEASGDVFNTHTPSRASVVVDRCSRLWMEASGNAFTTHLLSHTLVVVVR